MEQRFLRSVPALSEDEQKLLRCRHAAVIGCGGLGGYIVEILARAGLGTITVADGDSFEESNLNRQCLALPSNLGKGKAAAAAKRIRDIDPDVSLRCFEEPFSAEKASEMLCGADIVMDALDNIPDRLLLEKCCAEAGIPLVHGAVEGWTAQVCLCPPGSGILSRLYTGTSSSAGKSVLSHVPALCASLQCSLAIHALCAREIPRPDALIVLDTESMTFMELSL